MHPDLRILNRVLNSTIRENHRIVESWLQKVIFEKMRVFHEIGLLCMGLAGKSWKYLEILGIQQMLGIFGSQLYLTGRCWDYWQIAGSYWKSTIWAG